MSSILGDRIELKLLISFALSTIIQTFSLFYTWEFVSKNDVSVPFFVSIMCMGGGVLFSFISKSWKIQQQLSTNQILHVLSNGGLLASSFMCLAYGLKYCGPVRTILFHYVHLCIPLVPPVILGVVQLRSRKGRAAVLMLMAFALLLISSESGSVAENGNSSALTGDAQAEDTGDSALEESEKIPSFGAVSEYDFGSTGSFLGCLSLVLSSILFTRQRKRSKEWAKIFGNSERFYGLSLLAGGLGALILTALMHVVTSESTVTFWPSGGVFHYTMAIVCWLSCGHMADGFGTKLSKIFSVSFLNKCHFWTCTLSAIFFALAWDARLLSFFTIVSGVLLFLGLRISRKQERSLIPTYVGKDRRSSGQVSWLQGHWRVFLKHLREDRNSRRIMMFLSINFTFMFVEFLYGFLTNSLGLISDACHMLFDCIALAIGLYSSYIANFKVDRYHTYGYGRIKVLSGFINAVFLVFIGFSVFVESFERLMNPPTIDSHSLLFVSVLGFLVNLVGISFFHQEHAGSHGSGHGHSHGGHGHSHDPNIQGIFLHILADTLGSVGVIVSSLLIHFFGWVMADAFCSMFIAALILVTVKPLLSESLTILLQQTPPSHSQAIRNELDSVVAMKGILGYREAHFWEFVPGRIIGTLHLQVSEDADQQAILKVVSARFAQHLGTTNLTVQLEKETFLQNMDPSVRMQFRMHSGHSAPLATGMAIESIDDHSHSNDKSHGHSHSHSHGHGHTESHGMERPSSPDTRITNPESHVALDELTTGRR
eukprot:414929_1